jgi:hypothetical protein
MIQAQHGNPDLAITYLETSQRLDPVSTRSNAVGTIATVRFRQGRFDDAVTFAREYAQTTDSPMGHACLAGAYAQLGQASAAVAALSRYRASTTLPVEDCARSFLPGPAELKLFLDGITAAEAADGRA